MKQRTKFKIFITLGLSIVLSLLIMPNSYSAEAGLQAKPGAKSLVSQTTNDFFRRIRNMEKEGGTLGLNAQIDETSFLDSSKNGLDIHMAKNTEWGAVAMLATSIYGSAPSGKSDESVTGNKTGVYQMTDEVREYVAGIYDTTNDYIDKIKKADSRYYNLYTSTEMKNAYKLGDGTYETENWKNPGINGSLSTSQPIFLRGYKSLFGTYARSGKADWEFGSRAVVVCGFEL